MIGEGESLTGLEAANAEYNRPGSLGAVEGVEEEAANGAEQLWVHSRCR